MKSQRDELRARRLPDRPLVEGLELRLALSGDPFPGPGPLPFVGSPDTTPDPGQDDPAWQEPGWGDPGWGDPGWWDDSWTFPIEPVIEDLIVLNPDDLPADDGASPFVPFLLPPDDTAPPPDSGGAISWIPAPDPPPAPPPSPPSLGPSPAPTTGSSLRLQIVAVDPADGAVVGAGTLGRITVRFRVPLSTEGLTPGEFRLERIGDDGRSRVVFDRANPAGARLSGDGSELVLTPSGPLGEGRYRLTLDGNARFVAADGSLLDGDGADLVLSSFRVARPAVTVPTPPPAPAPVGPIGVRLADAIVLGTLGPTILRVGGTLDLEADPAAARLYRVELAPGHSWRLGLEVSAGREGSPLLSRLSLFDADGRLIRTGTLGMTGNPSDPAMFVGLGPGTYYVGISGAGNDPSAGGYDPATGAVPANLPPQRGGPYTLALVADVADAPTRLVGMALDRADPSDPVPTGVTLHFDGPLRVDGAGAPGAGPVEVVDGDGRVWRALLVSSNGSGSSLSLVFADRLPRGRYEIRLPASGGLVDLIGRAPVAEGREAGVLGRFEVATEPSVRRPNDLGALPPARAAEGVAARASVLPRSESTFMFVLTYESVYAMTLDDPSGTLAVELIGPGGRTVLGPEVRSLNGATIALKPGPYLVRIINPTGRPVEAGLGIRALTTPFDSVPLNGVGQGPALAMRLVAPVAGLPQVGFDPPASQTTLVMGEATVAAPMTGASGSIAVGAGLAVPSMAAGDAGPGMPVGPMLTPGAVAIGLPTSEPLRVAAIEPGRAGAPASAALGNAPVAVVPPGPGQELERPRVDSRWFEDGRAVPRPEVVIDAGQGGEVARRQGGEPEAIRTASAEAVDALLALLEPDGPGRIGGAVSDSGTVLGGEGNPELALGTRAGEGDPARDRVEVPLGRAVGIGVAVGVAGRLLARRRAHGDGPRTGDSRAAPAPRGDEAGPPDAFDELVRRYTGAAGTAGAAASR